MTAVESYLPLYRKYRPQAFSDLVGQDAISQALTNAIRLKQVAHAYLFCGPRGTGKTSTARILAKSLNCTQGPTAEPCQVCPSCEGVNLGNALDILEFDAASNNSVEDARELIESCQFAPMSGRYKIYIIDEVHMLSTSAFNALLKTLEEPPPGVIFVFATTEVHKVLPTIISRCQRFDFRRITTADIVQRLRFIAQAENIQLEDEALTLMARHARGGMRDAVGLLDQVAVLGRSDGGKTITRSDVLLFIGSLGEDTLLALGEDIAQRRADGLMDRLTTLVSQGVEPAQIIKDLTQHFRNLMLVKASGTTASAAALDLSDATVSALQAQAQAFAAEELPQILEKLSGIERDMRLGQDPQLWLEVGLLGIAFRTEIHQVQALAERVAKLEQALAQGGGVSSPPQSQARAPQAAVPPPPVQAAPQAPLPVIPSLVETLPEAPVTTPVTEASPAAPLPPVSITPATPMTGAPPVSTTDSPLPLSSSPPPAPPPVPVMDLAALHPILCRLVASPPTKALLEQHTFVAAVEADRIIFGCRTENFLEMLEKPDKKIHIQKAAERHFGRPMTALFILQASPHMAVSAMSDSPVSVDIVSVEVEDPTAPVLPPSPLPVAAIDAEAKPAPVVSSSPLAMAEAAHPLPPEMDPEEEGPDPALQPEPLLPPAAVSTAVAAPPQATDPALEEAKQFTLDILQGKLL